LRVTKFLVFFFFVQGRPRLLGNEDGHTSVRMDGGCDEIQTWIRPNTNQECCLLSREVLWPFFSRQLYQYRSSRFFL